MAPDFDLIITTDYSNGSAEFQLLDHAGDHLAYHHTDFKQIRAGDRRALFDLRSHLDKYVDAGSEQAEIERIGVCIAEEVLGEDIFRILWKPNAQRTLRIQLPGATETENQLAAGLARVPWEIARPGAGKDTLADRNLVVRVVHDMQDPENLPDRLKSDECLRVLFIFAESRGSRPLAARQERRALRDLFENKIYPKRRILAHFLTHGVTRERLRAQIEENGGYHAVHWSGHGGMNVLELAKPGGEQDLLSGADLLGLFDKAGGFIPRLFFLSACHSGEILPVSDWNEFLDLASGKKKRKAAGKDGPGESPARELDGPPRVDPSQAKSETIAVGDEKDLATTHGDGYQTGAGRQSGMGGQSIAGDEECNLTVRAAREIAIDQQPGYTGTAHALLQGGVASVVAMRYEVGDDYARELAVEFYDRLLAIDRPLNAAQSLTLARRALLDPAKHDQVRYDPCDHATPLLYGAAEAGLQLIPGRSPGLDDKRDPRLHHISELTLAEHEHFVGRTWELDGLGADFMGSAYSTSVKPVAAITGLGGMGKTALAAEALGLWESHFKWVLLYQAKPNPLGFDRDFLWDIHWRLSDRSDDYRARVAANSRDAVWLPAEGDFRGDRRFDWMVENLIAVLRGQPIWLVLDNFETNLKPNPEPGNEREPVWACQDPAWDRCLRLFATELRGTPSRVLITCRRPLAALAAGDCHRLRLGPLPPGEAALYARENKGLGKMMFGADSAERELSLRLLTASRFHPLLMDRLARLATAGPGLRPQLLQALDTLEKSRDYSQLSALFAAAGKGGRGAEEEAKELAYLDDALAASLDQLIANASPDTRRLLWMIAIANDPVPLDLLKGVWSGESLEVAQMRQLKQMLEMLPQLPPELQEQFASMPPELRARLEDLPDGPERADVASLLSYLGTVGLVTEERSGPDDDNPSLACHELVRERIRTWMEGRPDRGEFSENSIRLGYAERLEALFETLLHRNMTAALRAGSRALVYCVEAGAYERLGSFASYVVTGATDPRLLKGLLPHLEAAAKSAPEGWPRWSCLCYLADALRNAGQPEAGLPYYEQAAAQARAGAEAGGEGARQAWADLGWITGNWANALFNIGHLDAARLRQLESAEAEKQAGRTPVNVITSELEALRIDIIQGKHSEALPQVEERLARIEDWWRRQRTGEEVPEAPDSEFLARVLIGALDIAKNAHFACEDWEAALDRIDAIIAIKQTLERPPEDVAVARMNRANVLRKLRRFSDARAELEYCLRVFENDPAQKARTLGSLASLFDDEGDIAQAVIQQRRALAIHEQLADPSDRAISHGNLAKYLAGRAAPSDLAESQRHRLAALVYRLVAMLGQDLQTSLRNYAVHFSRAHRAGAVLTVPSLAELLADPAFRPLAAWLGQRQIDLDELQSEVDQLLESARQLALSWSKKEQAGTTPGQAQGNP